MKLTILPLFVLAACSADDDIRIDYGSDAARFTPPDADVPSCEELLEDGQPPGLESVFDGVWTTVGEAHDRVMDIGCSSDGVYALRHYLRIERGQYETYQRLYETPEDCLNAEFDHGGTVRTVVAGTLALCPEPYLYFDGRPAYQVALTTRGDDIDPTSTSERRFFFLKQDVPGAAFEQMSYGKTESTEGPLASPETTTAWRTFRRPPV